VYVESIKALIIVFPLSLAAFIYARLAFGEFTPVKAIDRLRNLFLAVTLAAFLIPNFWLMLAVICGLIHFMAGREPLRPAIYLCLLFTIPAVDAFLPGIGPIRKLFELYPYHILALFVLLPFVVFHRSETRRFASVARLPDFFFFSYALLVCVLAFRETTMTDGIRQATVFGFTGVLQYLAFSRVRWTVERLRLLTVALVTPFLAYAAVGVVEVVLGWHVYAVPVEIWNVPHGSRYLARDGLLRAYGTVFGPIAFGLFMAVAFALAPALIATARKKFLPSLSWLALGVGLLTSFSRGPWVGGALATLIYAGTSQRAFTNVTRLAFAGAFALLALSVTPFGSRIVDMLPFIGSVEEHTIDYRERLFTVGWGVAMETPVFGSEGYEQTPEMLSLIQGQGIIDIVNTYLRVVLDYGLVGLFLFAGTFTVCGWTLWRWIGRAREHDAEFTAYAQGYLAALTAVTLIIATTSSTVAQIQEITWVLCGMAAGLARSAAMLVHEAKTTPAPVETTGTDDPPAPPPEPPRRKAAIDASRLPPHLRQYAR
jgi:O-antigen ligase